jgi:hypothetical protein
MLIIDGVYIFLNFDTVYNGVQSLLEKHISEDGHVSETKYFAINLYFAITFLFFMGAILLALIHDTIRHKIKSLVFLDYACHAESVVTRPIFTFCVSPLVGLCLIIFFMLQKVLSIQQFYVEGPFEIFSEILLALSLIFMLKAAFRMRKKAYQETGNVFHWVFWFYIGIIIVIFFALMEEVSWGQTIFGWKTPAFLAERNYQQETNIHNLFNPYFDSAYRLLTFILIPVFISAFLQLTPHETRWYDLVLPHPSLIMLAIMLAFFTIGIIKNELVEELLYLFIFFYAFRVVHCLRFLATEIPRGKKKVTIPQR